jgi:hypothetical protein
VIEESLWALAGVLLVVSFFALWPQVKDKQRQFLAVMIIFCIGFVIFMVIVDVPMYWKRWVADTAAGVEYLTIREGISDAAKQCIVDFGWQTWREEIPWMTLYFTAAVWVSIALPHAPNFKIARRKHSE